MTRCRQVIRPGVDGDDCDGALRVTRGPAVTGPGVESLAVRVRCPPSRRGRRSALGLRAPCRPGVDKDTLDRDEPVGVGARARRHGDMGHVVRPSTACVRPTTCGCSRCLLLLPTTTSAALRPKCRTTSRSGPGRRIVVTLTGETLFGKPRRGIDQHRPPRRRRPPDRLHRRARRHARRSDRDLSAPPHHAPTRKRALPHRTRRGRPRCLRRCSKEVGSRLRS
jgi:hypothetical protein